MTWHIQRTDETQTQMMKAIQEQTKKTKERYSIYEKMLNKNKNVAAKNIFVDLEIRMLQ